jgi:hypothetical protein
VQHGQLQQQQQQQQQQALTSRIPRWQQQQQCHQITVLVQCLVAQPEHGWGRLGVLTVRPQQQQQPQQQIL